MKYLWIMISHFMQFCSHILRIETTAAMWNVQWVWHVTNFYEFNESELFKIKKIIFKIQKSITWNRKRCCSLLKHIQSCHHNLHTERASEVYISLQGMRWNCCMEHKQQQRFRNVCFMFRCSSERAENGIKIYSNVLSLVGTIYDGELL